LQQVTGHYCVTGRPRSCRVVTRVSGTWVCGCWLRTEVIRAAVAHRCEGTRHAKEVGAKNLKKVNISLPSARYDLGRVKETMEGCWRRRKGPIAIPGYGSRPDLRIGGTSRGCVCQIQEGSCGLANHSGSLVVWKSAGGEVLVALPESGWCSVEEEG
jgi:hypothetical protein